MGIEPITYRLQGGCSTIELRRRPSDILLLSCVRRLISIALMCTLAQDRISVSLIEREVSLSGLTLRVKQNHAENHAEFVGAYGS